MSSTVRQETINQLKAQLPYLTTEYGVERIGIFGSVAKNQATDDSDVDLLIEFNQAIGFRFFDLVDYLEQLLGRRVDILTPAGVNGIRVSRVAQNISEDIIYV